MKILFLNTHDKQGGAAVASYRLLEGLRSNQDCKAEMLVNKKTSSPYFIKGPETDFDKITAIFRNPLDKLALLPYPKRKQVIFSSNIVSNYSLFKKTHAINPDIIHLNWINGGFFCLEQLLSIKKPVIWTLHDMWAFTGGCHCAGKCRKYIKSCGGCPILNSGKQKDLSYKNFQRKQKIYEKLDFTVICPSVWMSECAKNSILLKDKKVTTIPNGLNTEIFKPINRGKAREILNLPENKKLILFGALNAFIDSNKGFQYLYSAVKTIENEYSKDCELVIFGTDKPEQPLETSFKIHYMGTLNGETVMALLYSACDVSVVPSIQESFGQTASESLACGTPVVVFGATGLLDIVDHKTNGYLAEAYESEDLAEGIKWILNLNQDEYNILSKNSREKALKHFDIKQVSQKYFDLYKELLNQ